MPKAFLIDTSRCTACRGCQVACKEWNELEPNRTLQYNWGSHQNPQDLNANNYKLIRFSERKEKNGTVRWNFFPDQCRHCVYPPCLETANGYIDEAVIQDEKTGAVIFTEQTAKLNKEEAQEVRESCPYDIPRRNEKNGQLTKCTMCFERISAGMLPACVKACPTGAMNFGEREEMEALAKKRLAIAKKTYPEAMLADPDDVNVIFLLTDKPKNYSYNAVAAVSDSLLNRKDFLAKLRRPFTQMM